MNSSRLLRQPAATTVAGSGPAASNSPFAGGSLRVENLQQLVLRKAFLTEVDEVLQNCIDYIYVRKILGHFSSELYKLSKHFIFKS